MQLFIDFAQEANLERPKEKEVKKIYKEFDVNKDRYL